ncbi:NifU family protein [Methylocella silvestris]|uniref:Rieske domain-containing protein n=1 Tax=Methylocella silvestris TaxID=199596 RepID=A0A2J7TM47_METSI|nr:NifU family protein [Methylocella silvestris]PNG27787.1 hypothetical protein CR492_02470 [Methylocella silvestris]
MNAVDIIATKRDDLAGFAGDIERLETIFSTWDATQRGAVEAYRRAVEDLNGEALRRLVRILKQEPAALAAMKQAATDEIVYAVLRRHNILKPSLSERVEAALEGVRPMLAAHGGDVELVSVRPPAIEVRFVGACDGCPASSMTFHAGVKKAVAEACPEITDILQVKGVSHAGAGNVHFISPFAHGAADGWRFVCRIDEIPQGGVSAITIDGRDVILSRQGAALSCFENACAHLGLPLDGGEIAHGVITCPYHGFQYDLSSGECLTAPEVALQPHAVRVVGHCVEVRLSS